MTDDAQNDLLDRLITLESRLAHHERIADELSDQLVVQGRAFDRLAARLARLEDQVAEVEQGFGRAPSDDKPPPHY